MAKTTEKQKQSKPVSRYVLERYSGINTRFDCPNCKAKHTYTKFVDVTTGDHVGDAFGRCDRVEKCGYFNPPTGDNAGKNPLFVSPKDVVVDYEEETGGASLIEPARLLQSMTFKDNLSLYLFENFDSEKVMGTLVKYKLGQSDRWPGATIFWQLDHDYDIRTGKIMHYNVETGKRVKEPRNRISWQHVPDWKLEDKSYIDYNLKQCIFGEHLVTPETLEIHIVESEKTAILCNIMDKKTWLAIGGLEMVNEERLAPFRHCKMTFYPDKGDKAVNKWKEKLASFSEVFNISINTSLEKSSLEDGSDLGDLIIEKFSKKKQI